MTITSINDGHQHEIRGVTGPAIPLPEGGHYHKFHGVTTVNGTFLMHINIVAILVLVIKSGQRERYDLSQRTRKLEQFGPNPMSPILTYIEKISLKNIPFF